MMKSLSFFSFIASEASAEEDAVEKLPPTNVKYDRL